jgi:radical SAM protein with 4Fe4S-binding SPASM domain
MQPQPDPSDPFTPEGPSIFRMPDCPGTGIQPGSYGSFSANLHRKAVAQRVPLNATIEVTRRCPLACVHCYNNLTTGDRDARRQELTLADHCRIIDGIADAGCLWVLFTGGEIFARRDFLDIYTYAAGKGLLITLFTNGVLINRRIADHLAEWRPFSVEITLYGASRETFDAVTRVPGSFDRCMRGLRLLLDRRLPVKLKAVVLTLNRHELGAMKELAQGLGLEFRFDAMINPRLDGSRAPLDYRLSPEEIVALDVADADRTDEWHRFADRFTGPAQPPDKRDDLYRCGAGVTGFAVDPYGGLTVCGFSAEHAWDLREGDFLTGWRTALHNVRNSKITRHTTCTDCEIRPMCGMCPAMARLENGDPEEPVDFLCRVAHLRARFLGLQIPSHGECTYCNDGRHNGPTGHAAG